MIKPNNNKGSTMLFKTLQEYTRSCELSYPRIATVENVEITGMTGYNLSFKNLECACNNTLSNLFKVFKG